jgi:hypothetical protein
MSRFAAAHRQVLRPVRTHFHDVLVPVTIIVQASVQLSQVLAMLMDVWMSEFNA